MKTMKTYLQFKNVHERELPEQFSNDNDVRYSEDFVEYFIQEFSKQGDVVLDPFMGFGTTLVVAERMKRKGYGIEYDAARCAYVRSILKFPERAINGDSTKLLELDLRNFDLSLTSPPYMGRHHKENPFTSYTTDGAGYDAYLADLRNIYSQLATKMNPGAHAIIEVSNLKHDDAPVTTLAWDMAREIEKVMRFRGEIVITWEPTSGFGYDHSYALVFEKLN